tara:strand:+ start:449 stop:1657 length:1209 start_codon:yes stop_codon:yes gene_type:complete
LKKIIILTYGNLSKHHGGKITTGLTQVTWQTANEVNKLNKKNIETKFLTLNSILYKKNIEHTEVYGFNIRSFMFFCLKNIKLVLATLISAINIKINYRLKFIKTFVELLFFEYGYDQIKPSVFHCHGVFDSLLLSHCSFFKKVETIITIHGITGQDLKIIDSNFNRKIELEVTNIKFSRIVFVATLLKNQWKEYYGEISSPVDVILNGVDTSVFYNRRLTPKLSKKIDLVCIGTLNERKGQIRILEALEKCENVDCFKIIFIGEAISEEYLKFLKNKSKSIINSDIEFNGYLNSKEIAFILNQSDYMILPSSSEGFGLVYIESILCGTPVIIPKDLPLAQEPGILSKNNSIYLKDSTSNSILNLLNELKNNYKFCSEEVSKSCTHLSTKNNISNYLKIYSQF